MTFDRILVGVDATEHGLEALQQALAVRSAEGTILALTVLELGLASHAGFEAPRAAAALSHEAEETSAGAREALQGIPGEARIVRGHRALPTLLRYAGTESSTLIAVGGKRRSRAAGYLLTGVATGVLHDAPCSVLVARPAGSGERWLPTRILVGIDGSEPAIDALGVADELAARLGSTVRVLAATGGKLIDRAGEWAAAARVEFWSPDDPVAALVEESSGHDLVVLGSRGLHGIRSLGSVSERVAHRADCSVLVVRTGPEPAS